MLARDLFCYGRARVSARFGASPKRGFPHELSDLAILEMRSFGGVVLTEFPGKISLTHNFYPARELHTTTSALTKDSILVSGAKDH